MIPVRLRLKNFLSYGENAGELDFESFDLACLSGGNGQGKSALLDAITWAVWGEARKAAGSVKPDDELLRIGAREMEVEFVFDLEGTRYRIVRSFVRSASGKSSKPGLELHVHDEASVAWHPLTSENVRATQAEIDRRVGIDYDTFINSAFLLQGRSDEFTKRKPAERKEVLGRILGLERYERLAGAAGERWTDARNRVRTGEESVERLRRALEDEPAWRREHAETEAAVGTAQVERDRLATHETALTARYAALDEDERRAQRHRADLARTDERRARIAAEEGGLRVQIAEAEALVARADEIAAAHGRFDALQRERADLDEKADRNRGLTRRLDELQVQLRSTLAELERRLERHEADALADRERLADDEGRLAEQAPAQEAYNRATAAAERARELEAIRAKRESLAGRRSELDGLIAEARNALLVRLGQVEHAMVEVDAIPARLEGLRSTATSLEVQVAEIQGWESARDMVRMQGAERRSQQSHIRAEADRLREEEADLHERRERIRNATEEVCPTCGTHLTPKHRRTVEATYDRDLANLAERIATRNREADELEASCGMLVEDFRALELKIADANGAARNHDLAVAEIQRLEGQLELAEEWRTDSEALRAAIDAGSFEPLAHEEVAEIEAKLEGLPFDEEEFEVAREAAAHAPRWAATLEELASVSRRHDKLARRIAEAETAASRLREDLDAGTTAAPLREAIAEVEAGAAALGYDVARHDEVRAGLAELAAIPLEVARLASARANLDDWSKRLESLAEEAEACGREAVEHRAALESLASLLAERPALVEELTAVRMQRGAADRALADAQGRLGGLSEKLARAALDRGLLRSEQSDLKRAKLDSQITRHLRQAFGPHGIPSLIIEETLPEVEDRANEILERLSGGRTRVALETQRDKKAGGTKETLEIRITDEQGVARPYETYSGGEAFRVNFALRIALSQLLAERAGVRVRTLVVDEGFGTQDQEGLQGLVDAIRSIRDDFDKILVITHLEEVKDAFPVRIEVTKRPVDGSTFTVIGA